MNHILASDIAQSQLDQTLRTRYPVLHNETQANLTESDKWHRSIQFSGTAKEPTAYVNFHRGQKSLPAIFRYKERRGPNGREKYWYCEKDWND